MTDDIKLVYHGSRAEGLWVKEILEEEEIGSVLKDTLTSSMQAGWADGYPEDAVKIFVEEFNYEKAKAILEEYFAKRKPLEYSGDNDEDKT